MQSMQDAKYAEYVECEECVVCRVCTIQRRQTPSLWRREVVSRLDMERGDSFSMRRRECFSFLYIEEADCIVW